MVLVTHLDAVAESLPSLSNSHILFNLRSVRTTLIRFNFAMIDCSLWAKILKIIEINADILKNRDREAKNDNLNNILVHIVQNAHINIINNMW